MIKDTLLMEKLEDWDYEDTTFKDRTFIVYYTNDEWDDEDIFFDEDEALDFIEEMHTKHNCKTYLTIE